jgi:pimeloyl-ACP methyl ester carboxylesterase
MAIADPFDDIAVAWRVDDIEVDASLTRPDGEGPFPAVIMVAGSGPTDRNWNTPLIPGTNGSAALLARALAEFGSVVLRYDKRVSGPQGQENAQRLLGRISLQGHLEELAGGVRLLADRKDVDASRIFVLSNSEGCIHALNYQTQTAALPFAGLILTAASARPAGALARAQIQAQLAAVPGGDQLMSAYDAAMADFIAGRPVNVDENLMAGLRNLILSVTNPGNQPFARELWMTDPLSMLARVTAPVLIVIGKKDVQVDWLTDGPLFESIAADHNNITLVYPEDANHVLKYEPKARAQLTPAEVMTSYSAADSRLDAEIIETITAWLRTQV